MSKGKLYIISGPSGSGKDTVMKKVFERLPELKFSISSITRDMREGEVEGEKYHFISKEQFEEMIKNDKLLEYNKFVDNYYGTPIEPVKKCIENGDSMLIEVDVNGAYNIRKKMPEAVSIFLMPPSIQALEARLRKRGTETDEVIMKRLAVAESEINRANEFDYKVINNDLNSAVDEVVKIIKNK